MSDLTLDAALLYAQQHHIILIPAGNRLVLWHPGTRLPRPICRVIRANTREVLRLIALSHVSVCPAPGLHSGSWQYTVKRDCCNTCARINWYLDMHRKFDTSELSTTKNKPNREMIAV